jgi:isocitrate dehydrogenase (NAD+)
VQSIKLITWDASERVARYAFHYAQSSGRKRVTAVHKANIMYVNQSLNDIRWLFTVASRKMSDGMFLSACRQVKNDFPDVAYDEDLLDRVCLQVNNSSSRVKSLFLTKSPGCAKSETLLGSRHGDA